MNDNYDLFCTLMIGDDQTIDKNHCDTNDVKCLCAQYLSSI